MTTADMSKWDLYRIVVDAMTPSERFSWWTLKNYRTRATVFMKFVGRKVTASEVTMKMLKDYRDWRVSCGAGIKTARGDRLCISSIVKFADKSLLPEIVRGGGAGVCRTQASNFRKNFADAGIEETLEWYLIERYFPSKTRIATAGTERSYGMVMARFSMMLGHPAVLSDLNDLTVGKWIRSMRQEELAAATINGYLNTLRAFWTWLAKKRLVEEFPTIENVPEPHKIPRCWLEGELKALFEATQRMRGLTGGVAAPLWWKAFLLFAWDSGERKSAILGLRWEHFDPKGATMEAPAEIRKGGRKPMLYRLKPPTVKAIEAIRRPENERIFSNDRRDKEFYAEYKRLLKLAGLPYVKHKSGPQKLRRTFASYIEANGGNATDALSHTARKVTTECYLDPRVTQTRSPNEVLFALDMGKPKITSEAPLLLTHEQD